MTVKELAKIIAFACAETAAKVSQQSFNLTEDAPAAKEPRPLDKIMEQLGPILIAYAEKVLNETAPTPAPDPSGLGYNLTDALLDDISESLGMMNSVSVNDLLRALSTSLQMKSETAIATTFKKALVDIQSPSMKAPGVSTETGSKSA